MRYGRTVPYVVGLCVCERERREERGERREERKTVASVGWDTTGESKPAFLGRCVGAGAPAEPPAAAVRLVACAPEPGVAVKKGERRTKEIPGSVGEGRAEGKRDKSAKGKGEREESNGRIWDLRGEKGKRESTEGKRGKRPFVIK